MKERILAVILVISLVGSAIAEDGNKNKNSSAASVSSFHGFAPGHLVVTRTVYTGTTSTIAVGQPLPPTCGSSATCGAVASNDGTYPGVWNNVNVDGNFGVTAPIFLDEITPTGHLVDTLAIPTDLIVTSFSSKSELSVNLSPDKKSLTFMGYVAPPNAIDVSNSNTHGVIDPTNPDGQQFYRGIAEVDGAGNVTVTRTNAYTGDNGRAAIWGGGAYYTVGNSNNGSGTPANVVAATGVQFTSPCQAPGTPQEIGDFSILQVIDPSTGKPYTKADKPGKDNNFRGLTISDNTLYITKGSGSNGINTVYQVGETGTFPSPDNAPSGDLSKVAITILPGFPTILAKNAAAIHPFGVWFADANTLYVADEGSGKASDASTNPDAGLQKWVRVNGTWHRAYVLQNGLDLGMQYSIDGYPASLNPATGGLRNITGRVNDDGTATIWAITATVSANADVGADPNKLVSITDVVANADSTVAATESFTTVRNAGYGEVLRGVSFAPQRGGARVSCAN